MPFTPTLDTGAQLVNQASGSGGNDQTQSKIVALDDGRFVVLWTDNSDVAPGDTAGLDILAQVYNAFGTKVGAVQRINTGWFDDDESNFSVAAIPGGKFVVVYEDTDVDGTSIRAEEVTVAANHTMAITPRNILADPGAELLEGPAVSVRPDGDYMVVYARTTTGTDTDVFGKTVNSGVLSAEFPVLTGSDDAPGRQVNAIATLTSGNFVIISENQVSPDGDRGLFLRILNSTGGSVLGANEVASTSGDTAEDFTPSVTALTGGGFVVVWTNDDGTDVDIHFQTYDASGTPVQFGGVNSGGTTQANNEPSVIALKDGGFVVVYDNDVDDAIVGQRFSDTGAVVGDPFTIANTSGTESQPTLALADDGRIIVAWTENVGGNNDIKVAIYDPRAGDFFGDNGSGHRIVARQDGKGPNGDFVIYGGTGNDTIYGRNGDDTMQGGPGDDSVYGGNGNDTLEGNLGADYLDGGAGEDVLNYEGSSSVLVRLWNQTASGNSADGDTIAGFEHFFGGFGNDTVAGSDGVGNSLIGNTGNDVLFGLSGDDSIKGGAGTDNMDGGTGADFVDFSDDVAGVTVRLWNQTATGGIATGDTIAGFESAAGGSGADAIVGSDAIANLLIGNGGNDAIFGLSGNDTIRGGDGADNLNGGDGVDTLDYSDAGARVTVRLWNQTAEDGIAEGDTIAGFEHAIGGAGGDAIVASDGVANILVGNNGNDTLYGLSGNDTITGGAGADIINGGDGVDSASYAGSSAGVKIRLWNGTGEAGDAQGDTFSGVENITGSNFNDAISGADGVANMLSGGLGNDTLFGKSGNDTFVFARNDDQDTIGDFAGGGAAVADVIRLLNFGATFDTFAEVTAAATQVGANTVINFGSGDTLTLTGVTVASLNANDFLFG